MFVFYLSHFSVENTDFQIFWLLEQAATYIVRGSMLEDTEVGVDASDDLLRLAEIELQ